MPGRESLVRWLRPVGEDSSLRREAVTMGFYTSVTLFASLTAGDDFDVQPSGELLALIWLSTIGLAMTHWFAATIATRLVRDAHANHSIAEYLAAHLLLPLVAAVSASVVVLTMPDDLELLAGRLTAAALLAVLVAVESRRGGTTPARSARLALLAFGCAAGIAVLKRLLFS